MYYFKDVSDRIENIDPKTPPVERLERNSNRIGLSFTLSEPWKYMLKLKLIDVKRIKYMLKLIHLYNIGINF